MGAPVSATPFKVTPVTDVSTCARKSTACTLRESRMRLPDASREASIAVVASSSSCSENALAVVSGQTSSVSLPALAVSPSPVESSATCMGTIAPSRTKSGM